MSSANNLKFLLKSKIASLTIKESSLAGALNLTPQTINNIKIHDSTFIDRLEPLLCYFFPEAMLKLDLKLVPCPSCHRLTPRTSIDKCEVCDSKFAFNSEGQPIEVSCIEGGGKHNFHKKTNYCTDCNKEIT